MSWQEIITNKARILFDKEKTQNNQTDYNRPCVCQDCRNYYKNIENNGELIDFLTDFGINYLRPEEIMPYDLGSEKDSLIYYQAYYSVAGILDSEFCVNKESFSASFKTQNKINVGHEISEDYFFIVIDIELPFVLDEERELPPQSLANKILNKIKSIFKKN